MKILFAGTPDFALPAIRALADSHQLVGVLTAPDRRKGRRGHAQPSPVAAEAANMGLPILRPERLGSDARNAVSQLAPELLVVVAYGKIFGPKFLSLFVHGGINLHPSMLPEFRGPSPIPASILSGQLETGCTVQRVALRMDAGAILDQERLDLSGEESTYSLTKRCSEIGAKQLQRVVRQIESGNAIEIEQQESNATYCSLIEKDSGRINWADNAVYIERMIRAFDPWPGAFTYWNGLRLSLLKASVMDGSDTTPPIGAGTVIGVDKTRGILIQTGKGTLAVERLQLQSKQPLSFRDFINGTKAFVGSNLGEVK